MHICMNWSALTFDWNQARAFLVTAELGSFSAAARALNMAQPTLGRQVASLEEALDIVLFERIGRKLDLTPAGRAMLDHVRQMGEGAVAASLTAAGRAESVSGDVCISVTDMFAIYTMPLIVVELRKIAPDIRIKVLASNDLSDLQRREADIAVRHVAPTQPDLITKKVREAKGNLYCSRNYLESIGPIETIEDFRKVDLIGIGDDKQLTDYMRDTWGLPVDVDSVKVSGESGVTGWEMARYGLGAVPMSEDMASHYPNMVRVLPSLEPVVIPYWLTTHRELHSSKRIRLVFDHLADVLSRKSLPGSSSSSAYHIVLDPLCQILPSWFIQPNP